VTLTTILFVLTVLYAAVVLVVIGRTGRDKVRPLGAAVLVAVGTVAVVALVLAVAA
jgi:hypothetical protein